MQTHLKPSFICPDNSVICCDLNVSGPKSPVNVQAMTLMIAKMIAKSLKMMNTSTACILEMCRRERCMRAFLRMQTVCGHELNNIGGRGHVSRRSNFHNFAATISFNFLLFHMLSTSFLRVSTIYYDRVFLFSLFQLLIPTLNN